MGDNSDEMFKNFAMFIPNGIERHPDGSPVMFAKYKDKFVAHCETEKINLEPIPVKERERLYKEWEDANIAELKKSDPV